MRVADQRCGVVVEDHTSPSGCPPLGDRDQLGPLGIDVAARCGYDLSHHRGVQVRPELLAWADVVLAMDTAVLAALHELADETSAPKLLL